MLENSQSTHADLAAAEAYTNVQTGELTVVLIGLFPIFPYDTLADVHFLT